MKKICILIFLLLNVTQPCLAGQYKVLHVVDGDTIDINYNGHKERIRMLCVDTPESVHPDRSRDTPMGQKASAYTKSRLRGEYIDLEFEARKRGKYGRLLAYVIFDGENFNLELVREGWSPYYTKYGNSERHHAEFAAAEKEAREKRLNVWASRAAYSSQPVIKTPTTGTAYHGNRKSYKFHQPGCRWYNCKNCTMVFNSRQAAVSEGYQPCGVCLP